VNFAEVGPLVGVVVGGVLTGGFGVLNARIQRKTTRATEDRALVEKLDSERRQREAAASAQARDALSKLLLMDPDPDHRRRVEAHRHIRAGDVEALEKLGEPDESSVASWKEARHTLIMAVDTAAGDFGDQELRSRLNEICDMLRLYEGPEKYALQMEPRTRYLAARHGFDCLGAFRRGEDPPARTKEYTDTLDLVQVYLDEMESYSRG
jgi:hypothetical protein